MNTQDHTKELLTKERLEAEHLHKNVLTRAVDSLEAPVEDALSEESRELLTKERLDAEHIQKNAAMRAAGSHHSA